MPYNAKTYQRTYQLTRYRRLRAEWVKRLGGKCRICPSKKALQFDHIDRKKKRFTITELWGLSQKKVEKELKKCQLLCRDCHKKKTAKEMTKGHGTWGMYRNRKCRCKICRQFVGEYMKRYA